MINYVSGEYVAECDTCGAKTRLERRIGYPHDSINCVNGPGVWEGL